MKISNSCFAITGLYFLPPWSTNSGFIVGNHKTLIVDSGSSNLTAQTIYGYANAVKPDNEIILLNTEKHIDHVGGNGYFFEKNIEIFGHYNINRNQNDLNITAEHFNNKLENSTRSENNEGYIFFKNTKIVNPTKKIKNNTEIDLGNAYAQILLTPGHTSTNLSIYYENDEVLFCGDTILADFIPNLEDGNSSDWMLWLQSLEKIETMNINIIVPGHGNIIMGKENIHNEIKRIKNILLNAIDNNIAPTKQNSNA